jgi:hypothetical protein
LRLIARADSAGNCLNAAMSDCLLQCEFENDENKSTQTFLIIQIIAD